MWLSRRPDQQDRQQPFEEPPRGTAAGLTCAERPAYWGRPLDRSWIFPPGAYQRAFFRTAGEASTDMVLRIAACAGGSVWTDRPTASIAMARTCASGSESSSWMAFFKRGPSAGRQTSALHRSQLRLCKADTLTRASESSSI